MAKILTDEQKAKQKEYQDRYREKNKDKIAARQAATKEARAAKDKARYEANREERIRRACEYAKTNKEQTRKNQDEWRKNNPEKFKAQCKKYRDKNKEKINAWHRENHKLNADKNNKRSNDWYHANKDRAKDRAQSYYEAHFDKIAAHAIEYRKKNPEQSRTTTSNRRARLMNAEGSYNKDDVKAMYVKQEGKCTYCSIDLDETYHVDHKQPVSRGGSNWPSNLHLTCQPCNNKKHAKSHQEYLALLQRRGLYHLVRIDLEQETEKPQETLLPKQGEFLLE